MEAEALMSFGLCLRDTHLEVFPVYSVDPVDRTRNLRSEDRNLRSEQDRKMRFCVLFVFKQTFFQELVA